MLWVVRPPRATVFALVALLLVTVAGCPCVWARVLEASPTTAPTDAAATDAATCPMEEATAVCCCCDPVPHGDARDGEPSKPTAPRCPCPRRAHGMGLAPEAARDLPPIAVSDAPRFLTTTPFDPVEVPRPIGRAEERVALPPPPDEVRRGVVLLA